MQEILILLEEYGIWTVLSGLLIYIILQVSPTLIAKIKMNIKPTRKIDLHHHSLVNYLSKVIDGKIYQNWKFKDDKRKRLASDLLSIYFNYFQVFIKETLEDKDLEQHMRLQFLTRFYMLKVKMDKALEAKLPLVYINKFKEMAEPINIVMENAIEGIIASNSDHINKTNEVFNSIETLLKALTKTSEKSLIRINGAVENLEY